MNNDISIPKSILNNNGFTDNTHDIVNELNKHFVNISKSTGSDGISANIMKSCGDVIIPYITYIINQSIDKGMFLDSLKQVRVIPIYKSGDKDDLGNYRSISILFTLSKICERHIANQLQDFFPKKKCFIVNSLNLERITLVALRY